MPTWGGEIGEITWRGMVPGEGVLDTTDPKAGIDEIVKHGLNLVWRFESSSMYGRTNDWARHRDIYAYARSKGVKVLLIASTAVWHRNNRPKSVSFNDWPCLKHSASWTDHLYCWSDDQLTEDAANRYADHLIGSGAEDAIVMIHPVDTGGLKDPEHWSKRCPRCKARWTDDERWKASANQLNIWNRVLKRRCPKVTVGSCIYPYALRYLEGPGTASKEDWQHNFYDYWKRMDESLEDESFFLGSWIYGDGIAKEVRKLVKRRPLQIHDTYPFVCGVFSTLGRRAALAMDKTPGNVFCSYMDCTRPAWETYFFLGEYLKDQTLPGSVPYDGKVYYNPLTDHTGPAECRPVLAKICREFWGENIAADMEDFLWCGVLPRYIENPAEVVRTWNKMLTRVDYDPTGGAAESGVTLKAKTIIDDAALMRAQAKKAEVAAAALDRVLKTLKLGPKSRMEDWKAALPVVQRDCLMMRARNCRYWLAAARAQANLREFNELFLGGGACNGQDARCPGRVCNGQDARCPGGVRNGQDARCPGETCNGQDARCPGGACNGQDARCPGETCNGQDARCPGETCNGQDARCPGGVCNGQDARCPGRTCNGQDARCPGGVCNGQDARCPSKAKLAETRRQFEADYAAAEAWGPAKRREWSLKRESLEAELVKAELSVALATKPTDERAQAMRARTWTLPADPKPLVDYPTKSKTTVTWSGEVVVDKPIDLPSHKLRVLPGTKVLFKGEGRINLVKGALTAWGAAFEADSVLTNNFRIALDMADLHLNGCTFRNVRTVKPSKWATRGMIAAGVKPESRVENCLFENCSPVVLMASRRATFANNRVVGGFDGFGGVFVSGSPQMSVTGNLFENVRGRAVDLQGGDEVFIADNVFVACEEGVGGYEGIGGWAPGVGDRILGNAFFGLKNPIRFRSKPFLGGTVAGNWFEGCTALEIKDDPNRPHREFDNVFRR